MSADTDHFVIYGLEARFTHEPSADEWWQESAFLGWGDDAAGIGGVFRLGLEPNHGGSGRVTVWSGVVTPDQAIYHRTDRLPYGPNSRGERRWAAQDLISFEYDAADDRLSRWTLRDEGVAVDLEIEDLHRPKALFASNGWSIKDRQAKDHLEGGVAVRGTVELAGRRYDINGRGYRDHSWGIRHWRTLVAHRWMSGTLDNGTSFCAASFLNLDNTLFRVGMIVDHESGIARYTNELDSVVFMEADGCSHRGGLSVMRMPEGDEYRFEFEPIGKAPISWHEHVACLDAPCVVSSGGARGIGILETSTNPQQGLERPLTNLVSATVENGLYTDEAWVRMRRPFGNLLATSTSNAGAR